MTYVEELNPRTRQAVEHVLRLCRDGFTGQLVIHFKDGVPQRAQVTATQSYGVPKAGVLDQRVVR